MQLWKCLILTSIILLCSYLLNAQIITTIAGNGTPVSTGDGGPATAAGIAYPAACNFDTIGNFYFGENLAGPKIRMINTAGVIITVAGNGTSGFSGDNGPATAAKIAYPIGIADAIGNLFVVDYYNNRVRKVDVGTGIIHTIAGNGIATSTGNGGPATAATMVPIFVCVDGNGNVFISDQGPVGGIGSIRKINASTGIISFVAGTTAQGMCFDASGKLYLGGGSRVFKVDTATGAIDTIAGTGLTGPYNGDEIPATTANFEVFDIARDANGNIYIADEGNDRIRMIDALGIIHTVTGTGIAGYSGDNGPASVAQIYNPEGVAIDSCGNLFIADDANKRIRKVTYPHCNYLSVPKENTTIVKIYPNPANDVLHIDNIKTQANYSLLSIIGTVMQQGNLIEGSNSIPIQSLPAGMYMVEVTNKEGEKITTKVIKQ